MMHRLMNIKFSENNVLTWAAVIKHWFFYHTTTTSNIYKIDDL